MLIPETEIIISRNGAELRRTRVRPGDYVIGRDAAAEIAIDEEGVAGRHAQLTVNFDHVLIEDLGSSHGTFINGKPVTEMTRLWPNQKIQIGAATIELRRLKGASDSDQSLAPQTAAVRSMLPEEFLREKKYDIGGVVARGGMGAILDAKETTTERTVAMKVMLDGSSPDDLARFVSEAKVTAQLEHPNIVPVHELSVDENDQVFYTMKFVRGITLKKVLELMAEGFEATVVKYPLGTLLTIFQKVCDAVAFAHSKGVVHRDLKPENVMIGDFGEVLLMDWGLAKRIKDEGRTMKDEEVRPSAECLVPSAKPLTSSSILHPSALTLAGSIMGTPQYMAPEQARGETETLDERADIYALGAILYHILALRPSVRGDDAMTIVATVARGEIEPLMKGAGSRRQAPIRPKGGAAALHHLPDGRIPDSLAAVVHKAMAFDRAERYASVADLQADLTAYQNGFATSAEHAGAWKQFALFVRRNKAASIGVAAVLLVGATLGTKAILEGQRAEREAVRARSEAVRAEREAAAAKATLADLRRTAPVFYQQAKVVFDDGKLDEALEKIGYAIQLDPVQPDYHLFRANLLESSQKLVEAAEGYRRVLALRPVDAAALTNLTLCEKLRQESGGGPLQRAQQNQLLTALREQRRLVEAAPLAAIFDPDIALARAAILARLREARKQPGWADGYNLRTEPDGTFRVSMNKMAPIDFSVLRGQPITKLSLSETKIADLSSLAGLPLKELLLNGCRMTDLSPLRGMPLEALELGSAPVTDLSPLRGMKLRSLYLWRSAVEDLTPLARMPLTDLNCFECRNVRDFTLLRELPFLQRLNVGGVSLKDLTPLSSLVHLEELAIARNPCTDLSPLARLPLTSLDCFESRITSVVPLRGMPLRFLNLSGTPISDAEPLADCPTLEELILPLTPVKIDALRNLPNLKRISKGYSGNPPRANKTAAEFWAENDGKQAAPVP